MINKKIWLCSCLIVSSLYSQDKISLEDIYKESLEAYNSGNFQKSYIYLKKYNEYAYFNSKNAFMQARSAYEIKEYNEALKLYKKILDSEKNNDRIKLEIAQCYIALKQYKEAKDTFNEVLKNNPPLIVQKNIDVKLKLIEELQKKHSFKTIVALGILYDTNIDNNNENIIISDEIKGEREDFASQVAVVINHNYKISDELILENKVVGFSQNYFNHSEKDIGVVSLSTAPSYNFSKDNKISLELGFDRIFLDKSSYLNNLKSSLKLDNKVNETVNLSNKIGVSKKLYTKQSDSSKNFLSYEVEQNINLLTKAFGNNTLILAYGQDKKRDSIRTDIDKDFYKLSYLNRYNIYKTIYMSNQFTYQRNNYKDETVNSILNINTKREDDNLSYDLGFLYQFNKDLLFSTNIQYTTNDSNIQQYEYDKLTTKGYLYYAF